MEISIFGLRDWAIKHISLGYVVGPYLSDAIQACKTAAHLGWASTINPFHYEKDTAEKVCSNYKLALKAIVKENIDCYLSVKVWELNYDLGFLKEILELSEKSKIRIHFDSRDPESAATCFNLFEKALSIYRNISYTLPSRWKRSMTDAEKIIDFGVPVRLVKGQWDDITKPFINPRDGFLNLINILSGRAKHVDVATHDTNLARQSLMRLKEKKTPCHLELLYGLPIRNAYIAQALELPVRIYIPYGRACIPYGLSLVSKRPKILFWIMRDLLFKKRFLSNHRL